MLLMLEQVDVHMWLTLMLGADPENLAVHSMFDFQEWAAWM